YLKRLTPEQRESLDQALRLSIETDQTAIANFLYTRQGEVVLNRVGEVVRTRSNPGFYAIRAGLILAAGEPNGLTPVGFLRQFPTDSLIVDIDRGLRILREFRQLVGATNNAVNYVTTLSNQAAASNPVAIANPNLPRRRGEYRWQTRTFTVTDTPRQRQFRVDLYLPERSDAPLVVISHGLGSNRESFRYLAEHLASRGYAVAAPDHPGSDATYIEDLLEGTASQVTPPGEFADRPLDISALLDDLERQTTAGELPVSLDLTRVGIVGQSFGGYTALALAGAAINFSKLEADCSESNVQDTLNLSLLLQCRALELRTDADQDQLSLADERIAAAIAINPIGSSIFGESGLQQVEIPIMVMSGSGDFVAPTLAEQLIPFTWLASDSKYLALLRNGTHFSAIGDSTATGNSIPLPPEILGPEPGLAQDYVEALGLAFFEAQLRDQPDYLPYLSATYAQLLSREPLPLQLVQSLGGINIARARGAAPSR
ncbi:MAG: alpha/beta fold hydrolase, partial [Elainellaceae cyanobacterium]